MRTATLWAAGVFLLWLLTLTLQAAAGSGPDRSVAIQVPLALLVLSGPLLSWMLRARRERLRAPLLAAQLGCYVLYETGLSIETNIRIDLLLIYPAILLNAWILFRTPPPPGDPALRLPAPVRAAAFLGTLVALTGLLGSVYLFVTPIGVADDPTLHLPPAFKAYCFFGGGVGLVVSCLLLWGARQLRRSAPRGPATFRIGAVLYMLVAAFFTAAALLSQQALIRANFVPAVFLLVMTGILLLLVRRSAYRPTAPATSTTAS